MRSLETPSWVTLSAFELRALARDRAFAILLLVVAGVAAFGTANGVRWARQQQSVVEQLRADESAQLDHARTFAEAVRTGATPAPRGYWGNPGDMRGFAYYLMTAYTLKPPGALAPLATGQSDLLPYHFKVNAGSHAKALAAYDLQNPRRLRLGRFDLSFVVVFLLPLAILAASYDVLGRERESGTLPLLRTHGVTPRALALARLIVRSLVIVGLLIVSTLCALVLSGFAFEGPGVASGMLRWALITLGYAAFWFGVAALVVSMKRTASGAAMSLAGAWLVVVILVPWCLNLAARTLHPPPSRAEYIQAQRDATDAAARDRDSLQNRFLNDHPELTSSEDGSEAVTRYALGQITTLEHVEGQLAPVAARFDAQLRHQQALVDRWQWLSPAVLALQAFNEVAGTSTARHEAFIVQTHEYIAAIRRYFNPRLLGGQLEFTDFDGWPRYVWREPASAEVASRVRRSLVGISVPAAAFALIGIAVLGRARPLNRSERTASS